MTKREFEPNHHFIDKEHELSCELEQARLEALEIIVEAIITDESIRFGDSTWKAVEVLDCYLTLPDEKLDQFIEYESRL